MMSESVCVYILDVLLETKEKTISFLSVNGGESIIVESRCCNNY